MLVKDLSVKKQITLFITLAAIKLAERKWLSSNNEDDRQKGLNLCDRIKELIS